MALWLKHRLGLRRAGSILVQLWAHDLICLCSKVYSHICKMEIFLPSFVYLLYLDCKRFKAGILSLSVYTTPGTAKSLETIIIHRIHRNEYPTAANTSKPSPDNHIVHSVIVLAMVDLLGKCTCTFYFNILITI